MAPPKRKRPHDEDELNPSAAAALETTRRVTRQTSIPPPPLLVPPKAASPTQRRGLRTHATAAAGSGRSAYVKTTRRGSGRGRARRALAKTREDEDDAHDDGPTRQPTRAGRIAKAGGVQSRRMRGGKAVQYTAAGLRKPAATKRTTRANDADVAETTSDSEDAEEKATGTDGVEDEDDDELDDDEVDDDEDELARGPKPSASLTRAKTPPARRSRRAGLVATITPVSPPQIPGPARLFAGVPGTLLQARRETSIKPPLRPVLPLVSPLDRPPKKVTEIKPPAAPAAAQTVPQTAASVRPPVLVAASPAPSTARTSLLNASSQKQPALRQKAAPSVASAASTVSRTATPATAPKATPMVLPRSTAAPAASAAAAAAAAAPASPSQPDRNIDKVVLGEICFRAWYPSYYGKEVLGDGTGNSHQHKHHGGGSGRGGNHGNQLAKGAAVGKENHHYHGPGHGHGHHKDAPPLLDRLYVCPFCFKYSKEIVTWHRHVQACESQFQIPGDKVYVHPKGVRTVRVPIVPAATPKAGGTKRRKTSADADVQYVERVVKDEGEWSIWEADGEKDVLFCQNLSLFAKLFLDNKSVFFDVTGFNYFLLVYTPPPSLPSSLRAAVAAAAGSSSNSGGSGSNNSSSAGGQASILGAAAPRPRVVGFFSKEKMSWDNNNLACILVFPPWQRKGLGALLMGISYEISRREGILGGPEKPISDLGRKGYKRFWASEVARWLLSVDVEGVAGGLAGPHGSGPSGLAGDPAVDDQAVVIDVADCSRATWIMPDDCLYVLREMGIVEDAGLGPPKRLCSNVLSSSSSVQPEGQHLASGPGSPVGGEDGPGSLSGVSSAAVGPSSSSMGAVAVASGGGVPAGSPAVAMTAATAGAHAEAPRLADVQRVRLSKAAVRQWVRDNHISLERACDPAGFIKDYTNRDAQQAGEEA